MRVEEDKPPYWARNKFSVQLWVEDECTRHDPDAEHLDAAWKRLFGEPYDRRMRLASFDAGDSYGYLLPGGRVVWHNCDGDEIRQARMIEVIK